MMNRWICTYISRAKLVVGISQWTKCVYHSLAALCGISLPHSLSSTCHFVRESKIQYTKQHSTANTLNLCVSYVFYIKLWISASAREASSRIDPFWNHDAKNLLKFFQKNCFFWIVLRFRFYHRICCTHLYIGYKNIFWFFIWRSFKW